VVSRGEVWWVEDPELGRRPHLVLTRQQAIPILTNIAAVPATRRIRSIPSELVLSEDDGMPERCALSFDNVAVFPKSHLVQGICQLSPVRMVQACRVLETAMGC
jgi:mRNA interferase MazF